MSINQVTKDLDEFENVTNQFIKWMKHFNSGQVKMTDEESERFVGIVLSISSVQQEDMIERGATEQQIRETGQVIINMMVDNIKNC